MTEDNNSEDTFHAVANQVVPEGRPAYIGAALVTRLTSDGSFVRDALAGIPVPVEEDLPRLLTNVLTNNKNTDNRITSLLEKSVFRTVKEAINKPEVLGSIMKAVLAGAKPMFVSLVATLLKSEKTRLDGELVKLTHVSDNLWKQVPKAKKVYPY